MLNRFRIISMVEGVSLLLLLFIAMPIKYGLDYPLAVTVMGWAHGLLFLAYVYLAMNVAETLRWSQLQLFGAVLLGMLPFGCFLMEKRLKRLALQASPNISSASREPAEFAADVAPVWNESHSHSYDLSENQATASEKPPESG